MPKFPSWLVALQMAGIIAVVIILIIFTSNPLALLGLLLMPQIPMLLWNQPHGGTTDADGGSGRSIGFTADLEDEDPDE